MKLELELELTDVYGGDSNIRYEPKEKIQLGAKRTKTTVRSSIGIEIPVTTLETTKIEKMEPILTFRFENGSPVLRLGGAHGKLWGAIRDAAKELYELGDKDFAKAYKSAANMIRISPAWVTLDSGEDLRVDGIPQILKGNNGMIVQWYDVVPKAKCAVILQCPDELGPKVKRLLGQLQNGTHLNKRRSSIRVLNLRAIE